VALDVYYREDILNVLRAMYVAGEGPATLVSEILEDQDLRGIPLEKLLRIYRRGFHTALGAVGVAFGLVPLGREGEGRADPSIVHTRAAPTPYGGQSETEEARSSAEADPYDLDLIGFLWAKAQYEKRQR
jgi:hypothetical protein